MRDLHWPWFPGGGFDGGLGASIFSEIRVILPIFNILLRRVLVRTLADRQIVLDAYLICS